MARASQVPPNVVRTLGLLCVLAGALGVASAAVLLVIDPAVGSDRFSYPFTPAGFVVAQAWFSIHHLGLLAGLLGLWWSGLAGSGRLGRVGSWTAIGGMAMLAINELLAISASGSSAAVANAGPIGALYGVASTLIGVGLILAGVAVLQTGRVTDWRRYVPLALGIFVFVPMLPALFASFVLARLAIGAWMLGFAVLGWVVASTATAPAVETTMPNPAPTR